MGLIEPALSAWRQARADAGLNLSAPVHDLREIVNAILYVNRSEAIRGLLRGKVREQAPPLTGADGGHYRRTGSQNVVKRRGGQPGLRRGDAH